MNISKLLNPLPDKRLRFDGSAPEHAKFWLPIEIVGYIISFLDKAIRSKYRLVSRSWYTAYEMYHRNSVFAYSLHIGKGRFTRKQVMNAFIKHGHRLRELISATEFVREMMEIEPNFASLIPNVTFVNIIITDGYSSQHYIGELVARLTKLRRLTVMESGYEADEHLAVELDKAVANMKHLRKIEIFESVLDASALPGPNLKAIGSQMEHLELPVATAVPGTVTSSFEAFRNIKILGLMMISSVEILREVADMVSNSKNFPVMYQLYVFTEIDITRTPPIVNEDDGSLVTGLDLFEKICSIRRHPRFELNIGFTLGACSTTDAALIAKEREFVINLGKNHVDVLMGLQLTHFTPAGDYDPLTTLFYESAPRLHRLAFMRLYVSPTGATSPKLIAAFNNEFLLPRLEYVEVFVDGSQSPEWKRGYDPIDQSRGMWFDIRENDTVDKWRITSETNDGRVPSPFLSDE